MYGEVGFLLLPPPTVHKFTICIQGKGADGKRLVIDLEDDELGNVGKL